MRGLTLHQPWASAVALGHKRYETRSRRTHYRGALAIHSAKVWELPQRLHRDKLVASEVLPRDFPQVPPLGVVVALVYVSGCFLADYEARQRAGLREVALGDWRDGRAIWEFVDLRPLREPVACRGYQGLWNVPEELQAQILEQVEPR